MELNDVICALFIFVLFRSVINKINFDHIGAE
jgi:hypothetical protein